MELDEQLDLTRGRLPGPGRQAGRHSMVEEIEHEEEEQQPTAERETLVQRKEGEYRSSQLSP